MIAIAHRLCRIAFALLRDRADFGPRRLGIEEGPFTRTNRAPLSPEAGSHQRLGNARNRASVDPVTLALIVESVTTVNLVGMQPETSYGAGLTTAKRGALVTPDGRRRARAAVPDRRRPPNRGGGLDATAS